MMRKLLLVALAAVPFAVTGSVGAGPIGVRCTCPEGEACYHYLNAPVAAPEDPCHCPACRFGEKCSSRLPPGWDPTCASNHKMRCFLRRHAASWHLACSDQLSGKCDCDNPHPEWCPKCGANGSPWNEKGLAIVRRQMPIERRLFGRRPFIIIKSPHFYFVTDVRALKVKTQVGNSRIMTMHEIAHLYVQRAEIAWEDFTAVFGKDIIAPRPTGIYFLDSQSMKERVAKAYIGLPKPELCYGGNYDSIAGGYPYNCCVFSLENYHTDRACHRQMRHLLGHLFISCWKTVGGSNDILPRWIYAGAGHWLARLPRLLSNGATFCSGEGNEIWNSGRKWDERVLSYASDPHSLPIEKIFAASTLGALTLEMHIRAWSMFSLFLAEDQKEFVAFLAKVREGVDQRKALEETMHISPGELEKRWRDRVLGRRASVAPTPAELDAAHPGTPGAAERDSIRHEKDPDRLAAKILSLHVVDDPLTAATLLPFLGDSDEAVRETAVLVLSRTKDPAVLAWLRTKGLATAGGLTRSNLVRAMSRTGDSKAGPALAGCLSDPAWLTRAHAAIGVGRLRVKGAMSALGALLRDRVALVQVAAMDGLGMFGKAASAWEMAVARHLNDPAWQSRSAAAVTLGEIGTKASVDPLVARMEIESGRVRLDIRAALVKITGDDLGLDPKNWKKWWAGARNRPLPPPGSSRPRHPSADAGRYAAPPTWYGIRVHSSRVGYVLDASSSMAYAIKVDPKWIRHHRRKYGAQGTKYSLASHELLASLSSLSPSTQFGVWFMTSRSIPFSSSLVPATPAEAAAAGTRIESMAPRGDQGDRNRKTNYIDVFRDLMGAKAGTPPAPVFPKGPDTVLFLTDGKPTEGDITEPDVLLSWIEERNLFARMKVNAVTFGSRESRLDFLAELARENGGKFEFVPEVK